jgi:peptide deformylase
MLRRTLYARAGIRDTVRDGSVKLAHFPHVSLTIPAALVTLDEFRNSTAFPLQVERLNDSANRLQCLSLSAPKIRWHAQVMVLKATPDMDDYEVYVNPEAPGYDDKHSIAPMFGMWENCICCGSLHAWCIRPQVIAVRAQDEFGDWREAVLDGLRARLFMHELDHLRGTSYLQQCPSTDFIVSSAALSQRELWPANFPSMEARMTGMNQVFNYSTNRVETPPGLEWASQLQSAFVSFQANRVAEK